MNSLYWRIYYSGYDCLYYWQNNCWIVEQIHDRQILCSLFVKMQNQNIKVKLGYLFDKHK